MVPGLEVLVQSCPETGSRRGHSVSRFPSEIVNHRTPIRHFSFNLESQGEDTQERIRRQVGEDQNELLPRRQEEERRSKVFEGNPSDLGRSAVLVLKRVDHIPFRDENRNVRLDLLKILGNLSPFFLCVCVVRPD